MGRKIPSTGEKARETGSWNGSDLRWRVYTACWAAKHASVIPGDFVECGVNRGGMSLAVMEYIDFNDLDNGFSWARIVDSLKAWRQARRRQIFTAIAIAMTT